MKSLKVAILSEMQAAKRELRNCDISNLEHAVHSFRRRCKRIRAYLGLMPSTRDQLAERARRMVRRAAALLSELRDSQVAKRLACRMMERDRSSEIWPMAVEVCVKDPNESSEINSLNSAKALLRSSLKKLDKGKQFVLSMPTGQRKRKLLAKFLETYKAARSAVENVTARSSPEDFHELRKLIKKFCFQCQFVKSAYGKPLKVDIEHARTLAEKLGDAMDLVLLSTKLGKTTSNDLASKVAVIDEFQVEMAKLFHESLLLAYQLFFETSKAFAKRIE